MGAALLVTGSTITTTPPLTRRSCLTDLLSGSTEPQSRTQMRMETLSSSQVLSIMFPKREMARRRRGLETRFLLRPTLRWTSLKTKLNEKPSLSLTAQMQRLQWRIFSSCFLFLKIFLIYLNSTKYKFHSCRDRCICNIQFPMRCQDRIDYYEGQENQ